MKKIILFLFIVFSIFFFAYNRELTEPDELKYVEISREMLEKSNFLHPLYNYEIYLDKGPLYFYILIFFEKIFGKNNFSYIFPSQIFSILTLIVFYNLLKLFGKKEDEMWLSILVLFSSIQYYFLSKAVRMDIVLAFFIIFSYYLLFLKIIKGKRRLEGIYGLSLALALLTKGPVALIWFWAVPIVYGLFERDKNVFKFIFHPLSLFFSFLPVFIWLFFLYNYEGTQIFKEIFQKQTAGRIYSSFSHKMPFYYYVYSLPLSFFPFTFFLPFSIFRKNIIKENKFLFFWFIVPFILFSLISGKLTIYLLPLFCSISFFVSNFLLSGKNELKKILSFITIIFIIIGFFAFFSLKNLEEASIIFKNIKFLFLWLALTFILLFFKSKYFSIIFCCATIIFNVLLSVSFYPLTYSISLKHLSMKYNFLSRDQEYGYAFCDVKPSFLFYSHKKFVELHKNEEVESVLNEGNYIIIKKKNFNFLSTELKKVIKINYELERLGENFYIISIEDQKKFER